MKQNTDGKLVTKHFLAPAQQAFSSCECVRHCQELSDWQWIVMGVQRGIDDERSGRGFLQKWAMANEQASAIGVGHFFQTLHSQRRLSLVQELTTKVARSMPSHPHSEIDELEDLANVDVYAGDGHYHKAAVHDKAIKGKRRAVGHFYTLNYRTHALTHLTGADLQQGRKKGEHDMHALKRMSYECLRQGAPKGRQVLYVWDRAGIDLAQWNRWKQSAGIYFLSQAKDNLKITRYGPIEFDREAPLNAGVLSDEHAATETTGVMCRYIRYRCPHSGLQYEFITNHRKIAPGVIAWLYLRRWDIEKIYDTFKNKLSEKKAWATSMVAKNMQAQFLCLSHNLMVLFESEVSQQRGIENDKETRRCQKRHRKAKEHCHSNGRTPSNLLYENPRKRSQITLKFIRWLRHHLWANSFLSEALHSLKRVYALL